MAAVTVASFNQRHQESGKTQVQTKEIGYNALNIAMMRRGRKLPVSKVSAFAKALKSIPPICCAS